jgi:putative phosphoribosyl transferase
VLAVPVVQPSVAKELEREVDELVYILAPGDLYAIGVWYDRFPQLSDEDVRTVLARHAAEPAALPREASPSRAAPTTRVEA